MSDELARHLKQAREARGEQLAEACEMSGISMAILQGLETARFDTVEPIYMRMGLRSYSEYLGLDTAALLNAFDTDVTGRLPAVPAPPPVPRPEQPWGARAALISRRRMVAVAVLFLTLVVAVWILTAKFSESDELQDTELGEPGADRSGDADAGNVAVPALLAPPGAAASEILPQPDAAAADKRPEKYDPGAQSEPLVQNPLATTTETDGPESNGTNAAPQPGREYTADELPGSGSSAAPAGATAAPEAAEPPDESALVLDVEAIDSTWVHVSSDGRDTFQGILAPGLKRRWFARQHFLVRSGRAHGSRYWFQGNLLGNGRLGESTRVLRFRADGAGITLLGPELEPLSPTPETSNAAAR